MGKSHFLESAELCIANGERLLDDADWVNYSDRPAGSSFVLATIAQEEFAKAFLLILVDRGVIAWNPLVSRATRDHASKQLLGLVLNYLSPDLEEDDKRSKEFFADIEEHKRLMEAYRNSSNRNERAIIWRQIEAISNRLDSLPESVADAIFIFRYEKIGRWESSTWSWVEKPTYDPLAKGLADGKLDREKQDALYVRLGSDGRVAKTPTNIKHDEAKAVMEKADRMRQYVKYHLDQHFASLEYDKIAGAFKAAFSGLSEQTNQQSEH